MTFPQECYMIYKRSKNGGVAQLGERTVRIRKVESSILFVSTMKKAVAYATAFFNDVFRSAERDVHFVRDVSFGSDVHLRCVKRNTSHHFCRRQKHHYGEAITSLARQGKHHFYPADSTYNIQMIA